ncbi:MAG: hypothetical protein IIA67_08220 [Planctomycetes bacterium]|nr:hypothetical protein [Planctomycetota bacterium]
MTLFSVECITCRRRLKVNHADAIGQILSCPGCGSMVEIVPPPDWQAPENAAPRDEIGPGGAAPWAESEAEQAEIAKGLAETVDGFDSLLAGGSSDDLVGPPLLPAVDSVSPAATPPSLEGDSSEPLSPNTAWASPVERQWKKRILLGGSAVAALTVVTVLAILAFSGNGDPADHREVSVDAKGDSSKGDSKESSDSTAAEKTAQKTAENPIAPKPPENVDPPGKIEPVDPPPDVSPKTKEDPTEPLPKNPDPPPEAIPTEPEIDLPPTPPANPIDVEARLADKVPQISLSRIGLSEFVDFLSDMSTVPITLDLDALAELRVGLDTPLSVTASDSTVGKVLRKALAPRNLDFVLRDGHVVVTHAAVNRKPRTVSHHIGDLAPDAASREALAELVKKMIEPQSWGGEKPIGTVEIGADRLTVTHSFSTHYKILRLLERLRIARRMQPRNKYYDASVFDLKTPVNRASRRLAEPLPANFHQTPLGEIIAHVNGISELRVVVDWHGLGQEGVWPDTPATLRAQQTLAALGEMLTKLGLALRVVDERTVQITSMSALQRRYDVQLHQIGDLVNQADPAPLIENIEKTVFPQSWQTAGGSGAMHYDAKSGYLIVRHNQGVQNVLGRRFEQFRKEEKEK